MIFTDIEDVTRRLQASRYIPSSRIATVVFLAAATEKPVLVEGPAGVGKTELARAVAAATGRRLIRLQCYEGLDEAKALYEWEYAKQLLYTQMVREKIGSLLAGTDTIAQAVDRIAAEEDAFFSERFIQPRPLLQAILSDHPVVLLIDEVDKADPEFEAFLLELLSDFQVTIPEIGTKTATTRPTVFLTSNSYRDMSDALKRRCLYLYIDYPEPATELAIVKKKIPGIDQELLTKMIDIIGRMRRMDLKKRPCISETLDWARSLMALNITEITPESLETTLDVLCKHKADTDRVMPHLDEVVNG